MAPKVGGVTLSKSFTIGETRIVAFEINNSSNRSARDRRYRYTKEKKIKVVNTIKHYFVLGTLV